MTTVVLGPRPRELEEWLTRRRALGQDRYDEVWEGDYHVAPGPSMDHAAVDAQLARLLWAPAERAGLIPTTAFNLGEADDYRVPDGGLHRTRVKGVYVPSAAMVIEIRSPSDETYAKFDFYAARGVDELLVADLAQRTVRIWQLRAKPGSAPSRYDETGHSDLLDLPAARLTAELAWP